MSKIDYKYDQDKVRMELIPMECFEEIGKALTFGAKKYKDNSWQTIKNAKQRYRGALLRHMTAMEKGEKNDPETGLTHAAHMACCAIFILWYELQEK